MKILEFIVYSTFCQNPTASMKSYWARRARVPTQFPRLLTASFFIQYIRFFWYVHANVCIYNIYQGHLSRSTSWPPTPQNPLNHLYRWSQGVIGESGHVVMLERRDWYKVCQMILELTYLKIGEIWWNSMTLMKKSKFRGYKKVVYKGGSREKWYFLLFT